MRTYPYYLLTNANIAANSPTSGYVSSSSQTIEFSYGFSIQNTFTGINPDGTISLYASNDGASSALIDQVKVVGDNSGIGGTFMWNYGRMVNFDSIRVDFVATSASSGQVTSLLFSKGG